MAERPRKRKRRGGGGSSGSNDPTPRERMERGYARAEQRNQEAREALDPLAEGERPTVVTIGAVISAAIAVSIVVGYLVGTEVDGEKPPLPQVLAPTLLMGVMAWGMWHARYWAVLGFQMLLVLVLFSTFFGLVLFSADAPQILATLALLAGAGTLFFFMVKAMARIQMPTRD
ncbi:MAG TPA: hypothetical protein VFY04_05455 [Solirubrobacterales bacterium]|nr:hypothetical protein [Solirubrobacterales bacterium]